jgi:predicted transcriptional regulator
MEIINVKRPEKQKAGFLLNVDTIEKLKALAAIRDTSYSRVIDRAVSEMYDKAVKESAKQAGGLVEV